MNKNITILIKDVGYLEMDKVSPIPLNFSIADIADISKKSGSFSKTLVIPSTDINDQILGQLYDINIADSSFNINRKVGCLIISNDIVVMDGYFRLDGVNKVSPTMVGGDEQITYNAVVFDENTNFFDTLGDSLLEDLDFSQYNHLYYGENVLATSAHTVDDIYTYPMYHNGNTTDVSLSDFYPGIYLKAYVDKIFETHQFAYESDFFDGITEDALFSHLLVPFNQKRPLNNQSVLDARKFRAAVSGATSTIPFSGTPTIITYPNYPTGTYATPQVIPFNDDSSGNNFDNSGDYIASANTYQSSVNQQADFRVKIPIELGYISDSGATLQFPNSANYQYYKPTIDLHVNGSIDPTRSVRFHQSAINWPSTISAGTHTFQGVNIDVTFLNVGLSSGDTVQIKINPNLKLISTGNQYLSGSTVIEPDWYYNLSTLSGDSNSFTNIPIQTVLKAGDTVYMNDYIGKNVKQKDFFRWIVQAFNLYIKPDSENPKKLLIKTRDEFYDTDIVFDWTEKFSLDRKSSVQFLPNLQNRDLILTYKSGSDSWNKNYSENWKKAYGRKEYIFDNDNLKGEKKIKIGFEATPLISNGFGHIVSAIPSDEPKTGIKMLYKPDAWLSGNSWVFKYYDKTTNVIINQTLTTYPYMGHFSSPKNASVDVNFGEVRQLGYWDYGTITDNTLGNRFYKGFVDQIIDGKMLTGYFDLNESDILNLDFSAKYFIKDTYYFLNRVIDFDINSNDLTKVELLRIDTGIKFSNTNDSTGGTVRPNVDSTVGSVFKEIPTTTYTQETLTKSVVTNNEILSKTAEVTGENNFVDQDSSIKIIGDNNTIVGDTKGTITGDDNTVTNVEKTTIVGDDNTVAVEGAVIFGDSITADTEGSTYISNLVVTETVTIASGVTFTDFDYLPLSGGSMEGNITTTASTATGNTSMSWGGNNAADGDYSVALGGKDNDATGYISATVGGNNNLASNYYTICAGGNGNQATGYFAGTFGGQSNKAIGNFSAVIGGNAHNATGVTSTIVGGQNNDAFATNSSTVGGTNNIINPTATNSVILGGESNITSGSYSGILSGYANSATTQASIVVGGLYNIANGVSSCFVGGGNNNKASGNLSAVVGGNANQVTGGLSTIIGGASNITDGTRCAIVGGLSNIVNSGVLNSVIAGGTNITADTNNTLFAENARLAENGGVIYSGGTDLINIFPSADGFLPLSGGTISGDLTIEDLTQSNTHLKSTAGLIPNTIQTISGSSLTTGSTYMIEANVTGIKTNYTTGISSKLLATFRINAAATIIQVGATTSTINSEFTTATITLTTDGTDILIKVIGEAATNIDWKSSTIINN